MHSTPQPPACLPQPSFIVGPDPDKAFSYLSVCPHAQSLVAFSLTHHAHILFVLPCRRWSCRLCASEKIRRLASAVRRAKPNRLLTLTVDPSLYASPKDAWQQTRKKVPVLIRQLRKTRGDIEYLRVTEVTKKGWPHYHLLVRSGFLPHGQIKKLWHEMTGAKIVDVRQVRKSFEAYSYLVKYLSKLHKLEWTERHVSVSKKFAPPDEWTPPNPTEFAEQVFHNYHPAFYLQDNCNGYRIERVHSHAHLLHPKGSFDAQKHSDS